MVRSSEVLLACNSFAILNPLKDFISHDVISTGFNGLTSSVFLFEKMLVSNIKARFVIMSNGYNEIIILSAIRTIP